VGTVLALHLSVPFFSSAFSCPFLFASLCAEKCVPKGSSPHPNAGGLFKAHIPGAQGSGLCVCIPGVASLCIPTRGSHTLDTRGSNWGKTLLQKLQEYRYTVVTVFIPYTSKVRWTVSEVSRLFMQVHLDIKVGSHAHSTHLPFPPNVPGTDALKRYSVVIIVRCKCLLNACLNP